MIDETKDITNQIKHGLESIDPNEMVQIRLKDFIQIYKTFEEFNRFFHQAMHYPTIEEIEDFIGNKDIGGYSAIHEMYYKILPKYLPKEIEEHFGKSNDPFQHPKKPHYYKVKRDQSIDDGTLKVNSRIEFAKYAEEILEEYFEKLQTSEVKTMTDYIENIGRYAEDIDGYYKNLNFERSAEIPTWRIFAQILRGATIYE